ncbi:Fip1 motif-domain-containing protein [Infundibulicybe gibba]|nr:Fip1 motif-domain-containing protein [Infundibulicybe gibba]
MDDDDEFLYGGAPIAEPERPTAVSQPIPEETAQSSNGLIHDLEAQAEGLPGGLSSKTGVAAEEEEEEEVELGDETEEEEEDDDIEIIMDQPSRSLDFRQGSASKPPTNRVPSASQPAQPKAPQPSLTTEYTPIQRGGVSVTPSKAPASQSQSQSQPVPVSSTVSAQHTPSPSVLQPTQNQLPQNQPHQTSEPPRDENGVDLSSLPPVTAPLSHPTIDPNAVGIFDGRSILEVDLGAMSEKPWRKPGSDISDWFNYGFDELSWEAYCYRRRELGEVANVLKANVLTFSGMPEDQLTALPPEVRQMVMTGTSAMMNNAGANGGMMGPGVMMDMSGMMGPMGMGMNGDMNMGGAMMQYRIAAKVNLEMLVLGLGAMAHQSILAE